MEKFCKIIETADRQILITKEYNQDDETDEVRITTTGDNDLRLSAAVAFDSEEKQEAFFDKFNDTDYAEELVISMFGDLL